MEIIDVWTQYLSPTPPEKRTRRRERLPQLRPARLVPQRHRRRADGRRHGRSGVRIACISGEPAHVREAVRQHPDRFIGEYHADPTNIMARGARAAGARREVRLQGACASSRSCGASRRPIPATTRSTPSASSSTSPSRPRSATPGRCTRRRPAARIYIDQVALDFPELRIICGHIGWPWTEEMIAVAWKHANVFIDTSAHVPKHYPPEFVHFMKSFGKTRCCSRPTTRCCPSTASSARSTPSACPPRSGSCSSATTPAAPSN